MDRGLTETRGSYRALLGLFNLPESDYKRFHAFLYQQRCNLPVAPCAHAARTARRADGAPRPPRQPIRLLRLIAKRSLMAQKILIVDDNASTRGELSKLLLADAGFETMTAATVPEAMRALSTASPSLLIGDSARQLQRAASGGDGAGRFLRSSSPATPIARWKPTPGGSVRSTGQAGVARRAVRDGAARAVERGARGVFMPPRRTRAPTWRRTMVLVNDARVPARRQRRRRARRDSVCAWSDDQSPLAFRLEELGCRAAARNHVEAPHQRQHLGVRRCRRRDLRPDWQTFLNAVLKSVPA